MFITTFTFANDLSRDRQRELRRLAGESGADRQATPHPKVSFPTRLVAELRTRVPALSLRRPKEEAQPNV